MPKLEKAVNYITIDNHRYSSNQLNYFTDSEDTFFVYWGQQPERILYKAPFNEWTDSTDIPYASAAALKDDLSSFLFEGGSQTISGTESEVNSRSTILLDTEVFTGEWENVLEFNSVVVAVATNKNGIYSVQFSPDGVNQDSTLTRYYRVDQIDPPHRFTVTRKFVRVVFTNNSGEDQDFFRLQTIYGDKSELNAPTDSILSQDFDAIATRPTDYRYEVALGRRQGADLWNKFGYNEDIDVATSPELLAAQDGSLTILSAASGITIVSDSANDTLGGTGANSIVIYSIDENRISKVTTVNLNGLTPVVVPTSTLLIFGINRVSIGLAGSAQENVGNISVTATTGGSTQAYIPAGGGTTQQLVFFTQAGHQALADWTILNAQKISGGGTPIVTFKGWVYSAVSNSKYEVFRQIIDTATESEIDLSPPHPFVIDEKSVFYIEVSTTVDNTVAAGRFSLIEVKNVDA